MASKLRRIRKYKWTKRRMHGFRARMKNWGKILKARRRKWRKQLAVQKK